MVNILGFGDEAVAAFIVFVLGIIFTVIWQRYTDKNRRLVYEIEASQMPLVTDENIRERIAILFDQQPVDKLYAYHISIANFGRLAVRNQQILFEFPDKTELIAMPNIQHEPLVGPIEKINESIAPLQLTR
jgi:hypothetical protein